MDRRTGITKEEINELPLGGYEGPIQLVNTQADLLQAIAELKQEKLLGFDTETRPAFRRGESYRPSVLQLAGMRAVYVIQLRSLETVDAVDTLLSDPSILKAGVAIRDDIVGLQGLFPFKPDGFVELSSLAGSLGYENAGLRSLAACLLGIRISKAVQTSNWANRSLTSAQIRYAATDAWLGRELYKKLDRIQFEQNRFADQ